MAIRILYDYDIFAQQRYGGISRCFVENIKRLEAEDSVRVSLPFRLSRNAYLRNVSSFRGLTLASEVKGVGRLMKLFNALQFIPSVYGGKFDLYHQTFYNTCLSQIRQDIPLVVTVHDMTPELYPDQFSDPTRVHAGKQEVCQQAAAVVCVSKNTSRDLIRLFNIDPEKVHVVPHGGGEPVSSLPRPHAPDRYILFVGKRQGYKNFRELAREAAPILRDANGPDLICVGGGAFTDEEIQLFEDQGIRAKIHHVRSSDDELEAYYQHASVMVYPSLYEGFGLPLLEAFRNDCPVVASQRSCFPEIADDAALYFEPGKDGDLRTSLRRVLKDRECRESLIRRGQRRRKRFTWRRSAEQLLRVYRDVEAIGRTHQSL